jgi:hypothetical protein
VAWDGPVYMCHGQDMVKILVHIPGIGIDIPMIRINRIPYLGFRLSLAIYIAFYLKFFFIPTFEDLSVAVCPRSGKQADQGQYFITLHYLSNGLKTSFCS